MSPPDLTYPVLMFHFGPGLTFHIQIWSIYHYETVRGIFRIQACVSLIP